MRCVIYARSSKERKEASIPSQLKELRALAKNNRDLIIEEIIDEAESAKSAFRPGFQKLVTMGKEKPKRFERIYCYDTSRFTRRREHAAMYKAMFEREGIEIVYLKLPQSDSYVDKIIEGVFEIFDEFHSLKSKDDSLRGMREKIEQGYRAGGRPRYGYRLKSHLLGKNKWGEDVVNTTLELDLGEASWVREYFERRAKGEPRKSILRDWNVRGHRNRTGTRWLVSHAKSFEEGIPFYLGHTVWYRHNERYEDEYGRKPYKGGSRYRSESEWILKHNTHEPIITEDLAQAVERLKRTNGPIARRTPYLLTGTLVCAVCGSHFYGERNGGYRVYQCSGKHKFLDCSNAAISQERLDADIRKLIATEYITEEYSNEFIREAQAIIKSENVSSVGKLERLEAERTKAKKALDKWLDTYEQSDEVTSQVIIERIEQLQREIQRLDANIQRAQSEDYAGLNGLYFARPFLTKLLENFEETMREGDIFDQRHLVKMFIDRIELGQKGSNEEREVIIRSRFPLDYTGKVSVPDGI